MNEARRARSATMGVSILGKGGVTQAKEARERWRGGIAGSL